MVIIVKVFLTLWLLGLTLCVFESCKYLIRAKKEKYINEKDVKPVAFRIAIYSFISGIFLSIGMIIAFLFIENFSPDIPIYLKSIFIVLLCTGGSILTMLLSFYFEVWKYKLLYKNQQKE